MNNLFRALILLIAALLLPPDLCGQRGPAMNWKPSTPLQDLPAINGLPDLFTFADGRQVKSQDDWQERREELKDVLLYYQYGRMPSRPDRVAVVSSRREPHPSGLGTMEFLTLEIDSREELRFRCVLYLPKHEGRRPVIIREEDRIGHRKDVPMFLEKGYIFVEYARHDLDPDRDRVVGPAQATYPNHDWATLAVWAWCGMRLVDHLETRDDVDMERIGITGHSRGGKMALLTAALDERISLVVPHQSGSGGAGSYRVLGPGAETLAHNDKPHWYHERLRWFGEQEERLPFDQHFLKALVAPRALLCTESIDDEFANPLGSLVTSYAAQAAYELLDAPDKNAIHFRRGRHSTETEDWKRVLAFAEWQFFGRKPIDSRSYWEESFPLPQGFESPIVKRSLFSPNTSAAPGSSEWTVPIASTHVEEFVVVGAPGNLSDRNIQGQGAYGHVDVEFQISKRQLSHVEYARFLNAVAIGDADGLYHPRMKAGPGAIRRAGSEGNYRYEVIKNATPAPITHVSWFDAARYCNWRHNGSEAGSDDSKLTEDGAYTLGDGIVCRNPGARYFLPTEDEWYKAAYFQPDAKAYNHFEIGVDNKPLIASANAEQVSPFGIMQYANKTWEWTESPVGTLHQSVRSGAWFLGNNKQAAGHFYINPSVHYFSVGFRISRPND